MNEVVPTFETMILTTNTDIYWPITLHDDIARKIAENYLDGEFYFVVNLLEAHGMNVEGLSENGQTRLFRDIQLVLTNYALDYRHNKMSHLSPEHYVLKELRMRLPGFFATQ